MGNSDSHSDTEPQQAEFHASYTRREQHYTRAPHNSDINYVTSRDWNTQKGMSSKNPHGDGFSHKPRGGGANHKPRGGATNQPRGGAANHPRGGAANHPRGGAGNHPQGGAANHHRGGGANHPRGGGANHPRGGGANHPRGGGANHPRGGGANHPRGGGASHPRGGGASHPQGGGANHPQGGGANHPQGGGANHPQGGGANHPRGGASNKAHDGSFNKPRGGASNNSDIGTSSNKPSGGADRKFQNPSSKKYVNEKREEYDKKNFKSCPTLSSAQSGNTVQGRGFSKSPFPKGHDNPVRNRPFFSDLLSPMAMALQHDIQSQANYNKLPQSPFLSFNQFGAKPKAGNSDKITDSNEKKFVPLVKYRRKKANMDSNNLISKHSNRSGSHTQREGRRKRRVEAFKKKNMQQPDNSNVTPLLSFQCASNETEKQFDLMEFSDDEDGWCTISQPSVETADLIDLSEENVGDFVALSKASSTIDELLCIPDTSQSQLSYSKDVFSDEYDSDSSSGESNFTNELSVESSSILDSETTSNYLESNLIVKEAFVSVFWDIENCALPVKKSVVDFANYVRNKFYDGRTEVTFTAACDVKLNLSSIQVRDMDEAAITLIHISSLNKNAADKKIMSLLQRFQMQYRNTNSAIVLISSDSDFSQILREMRYQHHIFVNLICKNNSRDSLTTAADKCVILDDILNDLPDQGVKNNMQHVITITNLPNLKAKAIKNVLSEKLKSFNCKIRFVNTFMAKVFFKDYSVCIKALNSLKGLYVYGNVLSLSYSEELEENNVIVAKAENKKQKEKQKLKLFKQENVGTNTPSNLQESKEVSSNKAVSLCVVVSMNIGDTGYWKGEFEKILQVKDFSVNWDDSAFGGCLFINFESLKKAQKARKLLLNEQLKNPNAPKFLKLIKHEEDLCSIKWDIINDSEITSKNRIEEHLQIIERKKKQLLEKHNKIMNGLQNQASSKISGAIEAVNDKLKECQEQMETFINFSNITVNIIKCLNCNTENLDEKLKEYLSDFTRECNCLSSALPIYAKKEVILKKVKEHQVIIIRAETGSGKSTQLTQYMWRERSNFRQGKIICTQPRKVAAISLAKHVSTQLGSSLGDIVGYQVGMASKMSVNTKILYVTDFTMLKILIDENLCDVSCVIIDEAHERTIYTDILLGMIKKYLPMYPHLKLMITSATIDTSVFRNFFSLTDSAVLHISGRTFPVEDEWLSCDITPDWDYFSKTLDKALEILTKEPGDILSFLTTPLETEKAVESFKEKLSRSKISKNVKIFCLHGKMNSEEQQKVFEKTPKDARKVVFATNCAETSITIPGIKYVIDCGLVKESKYDAVRNMNILSVGFVSKSSAEQRRGRAGRTEIGKCYRLYSKRNYENMVPSTVPEILRINLGQALLKLLKMGVQNPLQFDFIQSPPKELLTSAMEQLMFLKAVDEDLTLTELGKKMAVLPLEPRLSHLIFQGFEKGIGYDTLVTAALITMSQIIFFRNSENKEEADAKKRRFCEYENDFLSYLEVYKEWVDIPKNLKSQWCVINCINARSMRTVHELVNEIILIFQRELNLMIRQKFNLESSTYDLLTEVIFHSFIQNLSVFSGHRKFGYKCLAVPDELLIHPSSSLSAFGQSTPQYVVYDTILKTNRTYIVNLCPVTRDMILDAIKSSKLTIDLMALDDLTCYKLDLSPLGEKIILSHFIGKKGVKRKELLRKIKECIQSNFTEIDIDVAKGSVTIFCHIKDAVKIESIVFPLLQDAKRSLLSEEKDIFLCGDGEFSAVLTYGGYIKDVILPGEFREIKVILKGEENIESVCEKLSVCGKILDIREWKKYFKVTFDTPASAKNALKTYNHDPNFSLDSICRYIYVNERDYLYKVFMSFYRRPGTGMAYVTVEPKISGFALGSLIEYDGVFVRMNINKKTQDIRIFDLPANTDRNKLEASLTKVLPSDVKIKKLLIVRKKAYESSREEIEQVKSNIFELFAEFTFKENVIVDIRKPKANDWIWNAFVYFRNSLDGETAVNELKKRKQVSNFVGGFVLKPELKTSLCCKSEIFSVVKEQIEEALQFFKKDKSDGCVLDIKAVSKNADTVEIQIISNNVRDITDARRCISTILRGDEIKFPIDSHKVKLFSNLGKGVLNKMSVDFPECYILQNDYTKTISLFGKDACLNIIKMLINEFLNVEKYDDFKEISLKTNSGKPGVLKKLLKKYGFDLEKLKEDCGLADVEINVYKQLVTIRGNASAIDKCESIIQDIKDNLEDNTGEISGEICPICYDEVSEDKHRLQYCGHAFCTECLLHMFQNFEKVPLNCESCQDPIVVADIFWAINGRNLLEKKLFKKFLHFFVEKRSDISFCPSPDCSMVYRVTKGEMNVFRCPSCGNTICTSCEDLYHPGMTCSLSKCLKSNVDGALLVWKNKDPENHKFCPKCSSPIEKNGGCNHMTCWKCKCHMCWKCLRVFPSSKEVYDHQSSCLGINHPLL